MNTFRGLIEELGGPAAVARAAGGEPGAGRQWKARNSIPPTYWPKLIKLAKDKGKHLTLEQLAKMAIGTATKRRRDAAVKILQQGEVA